MAMDLIGQLKYPEIATEVIRVTRSQAAVEWWNQFPPEYRPITKGMGFYVHKISKFYREWHMNAPLGSEFLK